MKLKTHASAPKLMFGLWMMLPKMMRFLNTNVTNVTFHNNSCHDSIMIMMNVFALPMLLSMVKTVSAMQATNNMKRLVSDVMLTLTILDSVLVEKVNSSGTTAASIALVSMPELTKESVPVVNLSF